MLGNMPSAGFSLWVHGGVFPADPARRRAALVRRVHDCVDGLRRAQHGSRADPKRFSHPGDTNSEAGALGDTDSGPVCLGDTDSGPVGLADPNAGAVGLADPNSRADALAHTNSDSDA